jgi:hypothetical protein
LIAVAGFFISRGHDQQPQNKSLHHAAVRLRSMARMARVNSAVARFARLFLIQRA